MKRAASPTRRAQVTHCTAVALTGVPSAVRQAEAVCVTERVTAFIDIMRTSRTKSAFCSAVSERKIMSAASGANTYSAIEKGIATPSVIKIAFKAAARADCTSPDEASGAILGTLAAAKP